MSSVTTRVTEYLLHHPELYHDKTTSYHQDMYLTYDHCVFCLSISDAHNHTINYDAGHFIVAVLLDFTNLAFQFVLSVLYITLNLLMSLLYLFRPILINEWPPYIQDLNLFTMYGIMVEHVSVHERCMGSWLSLARNMFRKHDFTMLRISYRRFTVLFLIAFRCVHIYLSQNPPIRVRRFPVAYNIEEYGYKSSHAHIKDESSDISTRNEVYGGGI